jgi:orotidine-5'-phosphate decarboxylase
MGVWMVNVHASGGREMLEAARAALGDDEARPLLVAVTVLTSLDHARLTEVGVNAEPAAQVGRLARLAHAAGLDGVVCSPQEIALVKAACGPAFLTVTPGVRPAGAAQDDQQRIATPAVACAAGGDFLVIGRTITRAPDPLAVIAAITAEMARARQS